MSAHSTRGAGSTKPLARHQVILSERFRLVVASGPDRGRTLELDGTSYVVGTSSLCALVLTDASVSRRHLELSVLPEGIEIRDLGSTNGSYFQGARFSAIRVGAGASLVIGETELKILGPRSTAPLPISSADRFGGLVGASILMRQVFGVLERVAASDAPVLVQGETGTGKELVALALHETSRRPSGPFVVCDLRTLDRSLLEGELFGYGRRAATAAGGDGRPGAFARADGGTLLLDEIGELDVEVQPGLLRALERGQIKPTGGASYEDVDVRVVAVTSRDLEAEVKAGRFRRDLYHRLAVVCIQLPPLRERREDIPLLVEHFLARVPVSPGASRPSVSAATMAALSAHDWPGNVRELRNVLERAVSLSPDSPVLDPTLLGFESPPDRRSAAQPAASTPLRFKEAKDSLVDAWEREYLMALLERAGGNVSLAARHAGIARGYLHRLLKKHGLASGTEPRG